MTNWLNLPEDKDEGDDRRLRPVEDPKGVDYLNADTYPEVEDQLAPTKKRTKKTAKDKPTKNSSSEPLINRLSTKSKIAVGTVASVATVALFGGVAYASLQLLNPNSQIEEKVEQGKVVNQAAPTVSNASAESTAPQAADQSVNDKQAVSGKCDGVNVTPGATQIDPNASSLRNAVARFQASYFEHDEKGIKDSIAADSPLRKTNWKEVFDGLDKESTYCIELQPGNNRSVDADLTVTTGDEQVLYEQTITGQHEPDGWKIKEISERA